MPGLILDIILYYLVKSLVRFVWFFRSWNWPRVPAKVVSCVLVDPGWGCPFIRVSYKAKSSEAFYVSLSEEPFLFVSSARQSVSKYPKKLLVNVRMNPRNSSHTLLFDDDQIPA